jgi:hypothetical protein
MGLRANDVHHMLYLFSFLFKKISKTADDLQSIFRHGAILACDIEAFPTPAINWSKERRHLSALEKYTKK